MNTITFMQAFEAKNSHLTPGAKFGQLRSALFTKGVCWVDSIRGKFAEHDTFQVVLFLKGNQLGVDFSNPIVSECNGLVLQYANKQWRPLAVPTPNCTQSKISMVKVDALFKRKQYHVYELLDATIINIYFHEGSWKIASGRGYDVTHFQLTSTHTYSQAFNSIVESKHPKFKFSQLDPRFSYTFALRWSEFHVFNETKHIPLAKYDSNDYVKLMKVTDLNTLKDLDINWINIDLPIYLPLELKNNASFPMLAAYSKNALAKYAKGHEMNNFRFKPLYGYVLRAKGTNVPCAYQNIMVISSLYNMIKLGVYTKASASTNEMVAHMFAQHQSNDMKMLFDQYEPLFDKLESIVSTVAQEVDKMVSTEGYQCDNPLIHNVASKVAAQIWKHCPLKEGEDHSSSTQSLVQDCLRSNDYVDDLGNLLDQII